MMQRNVIFQAEYPLYTPGLDENCGSTQWEKSADFCSYFSRNYLADFCGMEIDSKNQSVSTNLSSNVAI